MNRLERRGRLLLRAYPAGYRRERGEEILGTLLEATPAGRAAPLPRDGWALVMGGLRARAAHNRRLSTAASLRLAALLGASVYLSFSASGYLLGGWPAAPVALLLCLAALLPWLGRWPAVIACVAAACAVVIFQGFAAAAEPALTVPALLPVATVLLALVAAAVLAGGAERPPWAWLWLPGLAVAARVLAQVAWAAGWFAPWVFLAARGDGLLIVLAVAALGWIVTDPRPAIGLAACFALLALSGLLTSVLPGPPGFELLALAERDAVWLVCAAVLAAPAFWRLRRKAML